MKKIFVSGIAFISCIFMSCQGDDIISPTTGNGVGQSVLKSVNKGNTPILNDLLPGDGGGDTPGGNPTVPPNTSYDGYPFLVIGRNNGLFSNTGEIGGVYRTIGFQWGIPEKYSYGLTLYQPSIKWLSLAFEFKMNEIRYIVSQYPIGMSVGNAPILLPNRLVNVVAWNSAGVPGQGPATEVDGYATITSIEVNSDGRLSLTGTFSALNKNFSVQYSNFIRIL